MGRLLFKCLSITVYSRGHILPCRQISTWVKMLMYHFLQVFVHRMSHQNANFCNNSKAVLVEIVTTKQSICFDECFEFVEWQAGKEFNLLFRLLLVKLSITAGIMTPVCYLVVLFLSISCVPPDPPCSALLTGLSMCKKKKETLHQDAAISCVWIGPDAKSCCEFTNGPLCSWNIRKLVLSILLSQGKRWQWCTHKELGQGMRWQWCTQRARKRLDLQVKDMG